MRERDAEGDHPQERNEQVAARGPRNLARRGDQDRDHALHTIGDRSGGWLIVHDAWK